MWAVSSESTELPVEEVLKIIMLGFGFDTKACASGTGKVNQGSACTTGTGCVHSVKSFTGTWSVSCSDGGKGRVLFSQQFPEVLSVFVQITRLSVYLHLLSVRTYLPRIYEYSVSLDSIFKAMIASSR